MKKLISAVTAMTLTLSLAASAAATPAPALISSNPGAQYGGVITVNGGEVDVSALPAAPAADNIPLRAVAEADHGYADWYQDENRSYFALDSNRIYVDCATGAVEVNGETLSGVKAAFVQGVTYVPASVVGGLEGYTVNTNPKLDVNRIDITTPNGTPLAKLGYSIVDAVELSSTSRNSSDMLESFFALQADNYTDAASFLPVMNVKAEGLFIGKVAGGRMDAAKEELEAFRARTQQSFEQYLPDQLELAKNGQVVTAGDYVMLIISGDNDAAIDLFQEGVKGLK